MMTSPTVIIEDSPRISDTICKFCGEDFKQFHHLQHHLLTSAVCRSKVYICQLCRAGYPTKLACLAHIQKIHPKVDPTRYASIVIVNDAAMRDGDSMLAISPASAAGHHGVWTSQVPARTMMPLHLSPLTGTTGPLPGKLPASISPYSHHLATYITTPPTITLPVKTELDEDNNCQPLDFSMKTGLSPASHSPAAPVGTDDQPIDLTIAAPRKASLPAAAALNQSMQLFDAPPTMLRSHLVSPVPLRPTNPYSLSTAGSKPSDTLKLPLIIPPANPPATSPTASPLGIQRYKPEYQGFYNPALGCLQCPHCSMLFKHGLKVQCSNNFSFSLTFWQWLTLLTFSFYGRLDLYMGQAPSLMVHGFHHLGPFDTGIGIDDITTNFNFYLTTWYLNCHNYMLMLSRMPVCFY